MLRRAAAAAAERPDGIAESDEFDSAEEEDELLPMHAAMSTTVRRPPLRGRTPADDLTLW